MKNLKFNSALSLAVACTVSVAESATLTLDDEIIVAADGTIPPFGDPSSSNTGGPQLPDGSGGFAASGEPFRYAARERQNAGQTNRRIATFLQYDVSALTPTEVNAAGFSATMTVGYAGSLNDLNTGMDLSVGRNVSGAWDSTTTIPSFTWAASTLDQSVLLADVHSNPNPQTLTLDVTSIVQGWVNGTFSNQGLVLFGTPAAPNAGNNNFSQAAFLSSATITTESIPEPTSLALASFGLLGFLARRRR